jgi:hypothetical protein
MKLASQVVAMCKIRVPCFELGTIREVSHACLPNDDVEGWFGMLLRIVNTNDLSVWGRRNKRHFILYATYELDSTSNNLQ